MGTGAWLMRQRSLFSNEFGSPKFSPQEFQSLFIEAVRNRDNVQWFKQLGEREQDTRLAAFLYLATRDVKVENNRISFERSEDAVRAVSRLRFLDRGVSINRLTLTDQQKAELSSILGREAPSPPLHQPRINIPRRAGERRGRGGAAPVVRGTVRLNRWLFLGVVDSITNPQRTGFVTPIPLATDFKVKARIRFADGTSTTATLSLVGYGNLGMGLINSVRNGNEEDVNASLTRALNESLSPTAPTAPGVLNELGRRFGKQVVGVEVVALAAPMATLEKAIDSSTAVMDEWRARGERFMGRLPPPVARQLVSEILRRTRRRA